MKNKYLNLVVVLLFSLSFFSASAQDGLYISLGSGVQQLTVNASGATTIMVKGYDAKELMSVNVQSSWPHAFAQFGIGYGKQFGQHIYVGSEIAFDYNGNGYLSESDSLSHATSSQYYNAWLALPQQWVFSGIVGYQFNRFMPFLRLAYVNALLNLNESLRYVLSGISDAEMSSISRYRLSGGQLAFGLRFPVSKHFNISAEYDYTLYSNLQVNHLIGHATIQPSGVDIPTTYNGYSDVKFHRLGASSLLVSLIYQF